MVLVVGLEPTSLSATVFETVAFTNFATPAAPKFGDTIHFYRA